MKPGTPEPSRPFEPAGKPAVLVIDDSDIPSPGSPPRSALLRGWRAAAPTSVAESPKSFAWAVARSPSGLLRGWARALLPSPTPPRGARVCTLRDRPQPGAITMRDLDDHDADLGDHDAPISVITMPISVITMRRSERSRSRGARTQGAQSRHNVRPQDEQERRRVGRRLDGKWRPAARTHSGAVVPSRTYSTIWLGRVSATTAAATLRP
jgi:hypothetical protein